MSECPRLYGLQFSVKTSHTHKLKKNVQNENYPKEIHTEHLEVWGGGGGGAYAYDPRSWGTLAMTR